MREEKHTLFCFSSRMFYLFQLSNTDHIEADADLGHQIKDTKTCVGFYSITEMGIYRSHRGFKTADILYKGFLRVNIKRSARLLNKAFYRDRFTM